MYTYNAYIFVYFQNCFILSVDKRKSKAGRAYFEWIIVCLFSNLTRLSKNSVKFSLKFVLPLQCGNTIRKTRVQTKGIVNLAQPNPTVFA